MLNQLQIKFVKSPFTVNPGCECRSPWRHSDTSVVTATDVDVRRSHLTLAPASDYTVLIITVIRNDGGVCVRIAFFSAATTAFLVCIGVSHIMAYSNELITVSSRSITGLLSLLWLLPTRSVLWDSSRKAAAGKSRVVSPRMLLTSARCEIRIHLAIDLYRSQETLKTVKLFNALWINCSIIWPV